MSVERTPKLMNTKTENTKQVFKERQPFQNKTTTPLAQPITLTKQITNSKLTTENNSAIKSKLANHASHLSSHLNQHTPNRSIKNLFQNGSVKQDSSIKKPVSKNTEIRSQVLNSNHKRLNTPTSTTSTKLSHLNSAKLITSNSKCKKEQLNPIINGVDYSDIIARKQELGYTGPGYIVAFDCDEKYLKGYNVAKGFWKLKSYQAPQKDENAMNFGPTQWLVRVETEQKTPSKNFLLNFNFGYNTPASNTPANYTPGNFKDTLNHDSNTEVKKTKKHLTWFDSDKNNLESINEHSSASTPQNDLTLKSPIIQNYCYSKQIESEKKRKSLRRSYSHNDLQNVILTQDDDYNNDVYYDNQQVKLNETFELICPLSARKICVSPKHITDVPVYDLNDSQSNDSLMNGPMSSSLSQSIDSLKIIEMSSFCNESDCITASESVNFFMNLMNMIKTSKQLNVLDGSCRIVADDCGTYMQLSNQINQLIKFGEKCKESLVLKKV